jgi:hypothetical protein
MRYLLIAVSLSIGCSATALSAAGPAEHSPNRWVDIATEQQLCDRLGGVDCAECAGRPDEASCYRAAYLAAQSLRRSENPFAAEEYVEPFAADEAPAPGSPAMAEQIREGEAIDALHLVEEQLSAAVRP